MFACYEDIAPLTEDGVFLKTLAVTMAVTCGFLISKTTYDAFRRHHARATFVVIGGGPCGLIASLIVARTGKASRIVIYEEKHRSELMNRPQQLAFEQKNVHFLKSFGVDFDNIEGCWQHKRFFTRIGVFTEYMLSIIYRLDVPIAVHLNQKFTRDTLKTLETYTERLIVIACDGSHGRAASLLGLSDEFVHHSCKTYGAVAALDRPSEHVVPAPEIRVHNLTFDLHAYGNNSHEETFPQGFHLKIFGSLRHRYMALAVPKCESKLVKTLKVVLDQSVMRSIFQACYNTYKTEEEGTLTDLSAVKSMKFSPRLFEIKLSQRMEVAAFVQDANLFVLAEGEAARVVNFHSGMDVNLAIKSLYSLETFIHMAVPAESETSILKALQYKCTHSKTVTQEYLRCGIRESMFLC